MTFPKIELQNVLDIRTGTVNPMLYPEEQFELFSIPGFDVGEPEIVFGSGIGSNKTIVLQGDVLFSKLNPRIPRVWVVPEGRGLRQISSTEFWPLICNEEKLDRNYLRFFLEKLAESGAFGDSTEAATKSRSRLKPFHLLSKLIGLPPLPEQRRIVEILDQADALRKIRREADQLAERILPALFYKMFGDPVRNPNNLPKKKLGELIRVRSGQGIAVKDLHPSEGYPVYGGNGINGYHSEYMFDHPVIVIGRVGVYCGATYYAQSKCWVTDNALFVTEKSEQLLDRYLTEALRVANLNQYAGRAGQPLISGSRIYPIEILVPSIEAQREFDSQVKHLEANASDRVEAAEILDRLFKVLLHRAFTGELTEGWRKNSAEALQG